MKIGCNWSAALGDLVLDKRVNIDYIKAGAFGEFENQFETMRSLKPVLLHGLGHFESTGMADISIVDFNRANALIKTCSSPHYGTHLDIKNEDMLANMSDEEIYIRMSTYIQVFKKNISVPLLLENSPDTPQDRVLLDHYPYSEPEKISKLLIDNDVGLLLDLTHAKVTSEFRNWNIYDYLLGLPLNRVKEIHVNGSGYDEQGFPADPHKAMEPEDYDLLDWILGYTKPDIITLEYCGTRSETREIVIENLLYQLDKLSIMCQNR